MIHYPASAAMKRRLPERKHGMADVRTMGGEPCAYCRRKMTVRKGADSRLYPTRDHVIPQYTNPAENRIAIVCWQCNHDKGPRMPEVWHAQLAIVGDPRASVFNSYMEQIGYDPASQTFKPDPRRRAQGSCEQGDCTSEA